MTIRTLGIALPCLITGWIAVLSVVALTTNAAPAYVILFPTEGLMNALSEETAVLSARQFSITLTSEEPGFSRSLYSHGALIVLPAGLPGCLPLAASI
ncbi:MAG: hypothetical protein ACRBBO_13320 [Cognatishimia sp.]